METKHEVRIKIQEHGPYVVSGGPKLTTKIQIKNSEGESVDWKDGHDYPDKKNFSLCRCGRSQNKPYCDATHKKINFEGTITADRKPRDTREKVYYGAEITMTDDEPLCAGYAYCDRFGGVWAEMEFTDNPEVRKRVERQISFCPSGRLEYWLKNHHGPVEEKYEPTIAVIPDGAIRVLGGIPIEAPDGFTYQVRNRQLLCRCGQSNNKPFCDGTHWNINFKAP